MGKIIGTLTMQGMAALAIVLAVIVVILAVVIIMLNLQIRQMMKDAEQAERNYRHKVNTIKESLDNCKMQMREVERQRDEAEIDAQNYKAQRDYLINLKRQSSESGEKKA